jgi:arginine deiminase
MNMNMGSGNDVYFTRSEKQVMDNGVDMNREYDETREWNRNRE